MSMLKAFMFISKSSSHSFTRADDSNDKAVLMLQKSACKQASMGREKGFKYTSLSKLLSAISLTHIL